MRKLIFIFAFVLACGLTRAQSDTVISGKNHIEVQYSNGDTAFMGTKEYADITLYMVDGDEIFVLTGQRWSPGRVTGIPSFKPSKFGYSTGREMANVLIPRYFGEYSYETYSNVSGSTKIDTAKYWYISTTDTTLQYYVVYGWSADTLTSKTTIIQ